MNKRRKLKDFKMKDFFKDVLDDILISMNLCPVCGVYYEGYSQFCSRSCMEMYLYNFKYN